MRFGSELLVKVTADNPYESTPAAGDAAAAQIGATIKGLSKYDMIGVLAQIDDDPGDTLDFYIQTSYDGGTTWIDWCHFAQLAAGTAGVSTYWTEPLTSNGIIAVGTGSSPAIAAGSNLGLWGDQMRIWCVPGANAEAGNEQNFSFFGYTREH